MRRLQALVLVALGVLVSVQLLGSLKSSLRTEEPSLLLGERLGLAGLYAEQLPSFVRSTLIRLALFVEDDEEAISLLQGQKLEPELIQHLTPGYELLARYRAGGEPNQLPKLRAQAYLGLWHLNLCFIAFCAVLGGALWMAYYGERPQGRDPEPPAPLFTVWFLFLLWIAWNLFAVPRLLSQTEAFRGIILGANLSYLAWALMTLWKYKKARGRWHQPMWGWVGAAYLWLLALITLLDLVLDVLGLEPPVSLVLVQLLPRSSSGQIVLLLLLALVVAPVMEELVFRVWLLGGLFSGMNRWRALILSSICFALVHGQAQALPQLFAFGLILGTVYLKTDSVSTCVVVHSLWNLTSLLHLVAGLPVESPIRISARHILEAVVMV